MTAAQPPADSADARQHRPDSDDYDLLTFGEVGARLSELLAAERAELRRLTDLPDRDPEQLCRLQQRIEVLADSEIRYRTQHDSNAVFTRRFAAHLVNPPKVQWSDSARPAARGVSVDETGTPTNASR